MIARDVRHGMASVLSWLRIHYYRIMGASIGKGCFISSHAYIDSRRGKISIGDNVSIAGGSYILSHTGFRPNMEGQETVIEDNVRIFVNSVVLPGVRIGRNSIVGAGSVVMRDVPPNVVVQGNPARVVQHLDDKSIPDFQPK